MSAARNIARKLRAWEDGRPIPRYRSLHQAIVAPDKALIVAFVRMAGESRPWGIAWGTAAGTPTIQFVPDGRIRDDVSTLVANFGEELLAHMQVHNWSYDPAPKDADPSSLVQIWLPNGQHVEMLHQLNYTYSQTKYGGRDIEILRATGRLAGWLFRESARAGQQHIVAASDALSSAFVFPAQDVRTAHLGYQLAWLTTEGDLDTRGAAAGKAEGLAVSPTMDPTLDRDQLEDLVQRWNAARRGGSGASDEARAIEEILDAELRRRWHLTEAAYQLLAADERGENTGIHGLVKSAQDEFWNQHQRIEINLNDPAGGPAFVAHPETDFHGSSAASRYLTYSAADESYVGHLIHGDEGLVADALDDGRAFEGTVVSTEVIEEGRARHPEWTLRLDPSTPHRLRENTRLAPIGSPGHSATVTSLEATDSDLFVRIRWTDRKTKPLSEPTEANPSEDVWVGATLTFVLSDAASLTRLRSRRVWAARNGPGAWLTHGVSPDPVEIANDDEPPDTLIDDIAQIEDRQEVEL